jgi:hypothetical protein
LVTQAVIAHFMWCIPVLQISVAQVASGLKNLAATVGLLLDREWSAFH